MQKHIHLLLRWLTLQSHVTNIHTHSQIILIHCLWLTPISRTPDISTCRFFSSSSVLSHKDEGLPVVLPCLHKIPLASLQALLHQDQRWCSFIPHVQVLPLIRVRSFRQHLHDSCDIHDQNEGNEVFANKSVLHFVMPLGPPMGKELGSCHLSDTNNFEKAPKFFF